MTKTYKKIVVWGMEYTNVTANIDSNGVVTGGHIKGSGKFAADSAVAALLNGQESIGTVEE